MILLFLFWNPRKILSGKMVCVSNVLHSQPSHNPHKITNDSSQNELNSEKWAITNIKYSSLHSRSIRKYISILYCSIYIVLLRWPTPPTPPSGIHCFDPGIVGVGDVEAGYDVVMQSREPELCHFSLLLMLKSGMVIVVHELLLQLQRPNAMAQRALVVISNQPLY